MGDENLAINDIESVVELVLEEVLGLANSCKEADDPDFDQTSYTANGCFIAQDKKELQFFDFGVPVQWGSYYNLSLPEMLTSIFPPPPKLA